VTCFNDTIGSIFGSLHDLTHNTAAVSRMGYVS